MASESPHEKPTNPGSQPGRAPRAETSDERSFDVKQRPDAVYAANLRRQIGSLLLLMPAVAAILRDEQGLILTVQNTINRADTRGSLSRGIPGGPIGPGESPSQAVVRHVYQSSGLTVIPVGIVAVLGGDTGFRSELPDGSKEEYTIIVFECTLASSSEIDSNQKTIARFLPEQDLRVLHPHYPASLFAGENNQRGAYFQWDAGWLDDPQNTARS